jgi:hypothetical protein
MAAGTTTTRSENPWGGVAGCHNEKPKLIVPNTMAVTANGMPLLILRRIRISPLRPETAMPAQRQRNVRPTMPQSRTWMLNTNRRQRYNLNKQKRPSRRNAAPTIGPNPGGPASVALGRGECGRRRFTGVLRYNTIRLQTKTSECPADHAPNVTSPSIHPPAGRRCRLCGAIPGLRCRGRPRRGLVCR